MNSNKVVYVDPNKMWEENPNEFSIDKLNIGVKLEVNIPSRQLGVQSKNIIAEWNSFDGSVSLTEGTDGSLTTSYTDITEETINTGGDKESFGIESINITYQSWYYPEVDIKFTDVRGNALMNPSETERDGKITPGSFFRALFAFPYPQFFLTVKGYYGEPVKYLLAVKDLRSSLSNETGNFDVQVKFIGYNYGFLTDLPMKYLIVAPNCEYGNRGSDLGKFTGKNEGIDIPTFPELLDSIGKMDEFVKAFVDNEQNSKDIITKKNKLREVEAVESGLNDVINTSIIDRESKDSEKKYYINYASNKEYYNSLINKVNNIYQKYYLSSEVKKLPGYKENENNKIIYSLNDLTENEKTFLEKKNGRKDKSVIINLDKKRIIEDDIKELSDSIDEYSKDVIDKLQGEFQNNGNLGFVPTISAMFQVVMSHLSNFKDKYSACLDDIHMQSINSDRNIANRYLYNTDVRAKNGVVTVPPFPLIKKESTDSGFEISWFEDIEKSNPLSKLQEQYFVNDLYNAANQTTKELKDSQKKYYDAITKPKFGNFIPALSTDISDIDYNPYSDRITENIGDISYIISIFMVRLAAKIALDIDSDLEDSEKLKAFNNFGKIEAYNCFMANDSEDISKAFIEFYKDNNGAINKIINFAYGKHYDGLEINGKGIDGILGKPLLTDNYAYENFIDGENLNIPIRINKLNDTNNGKGFISYKVEDSDGTKCVYCPPTETYSQLLNEEVIENRRSIIDNTIYRLGLNLEEIDNNIKCVNNDVNKNIEVTPWNPSINFCTKKENGEIKEDELAYYFGKKNEIGNRVENILKSKDRTDIRYTIPLLDNDFLSGNNEKYSKGKKLKSNEVFLDKRFYNWKDEYVFKDKKGFRDGFRPFNENILELEYGNELAQTYLFLSSFPFKYSSLYFDPNYSICKGQFVDFDFGKSGIYRLPKVFALYIGCILKLNRYDCVRKGKDDAEIGDGYQQFYIYSQMFSENIQQMFMNEYDKWVGQDYEDWNNIIFNKLKVSFGEDSSMKFETNCYYKEIMKKNDKLCSVLTNDGEELIKSLMTDSFYFLLPYKITKIGYVYNNINNVTEHIGEKENIKNFLSDIKKNEGNRAVSINNAINSFISELNNLYMGNINSIEDHEPINSTSSEKFSKLSMYLTLKNLYDRWLFGKDDGINIIDSDRYNFHFLDSSYADIGDKLLVDPREISNLIYKVMSSSSEERYQGMSVYEFLSELCQKSNMLFMSLPVNIFDEMSSDDNFRNVFKPFTFMETKGLNDCKKNTYIAIYPNKPSEHLNINDDFNMYEDDGADFLTNPPVDESSDTPNSKLPIFGVNYADPDQHYFKSINIGMDSPKVTDESIKANLYIASKGKDYSVTGIGTSGQNLFNIYSNNSYQCKVEMLGCAQIMPMMYFQLNNVPMFKGTYMIINVSHSITRGNFQTSFTGIRLNKDKIKYITDIFDISDVIDRFADRAMLEAEKSYDGNKHSYSFSENDEYDNGDFKESYIVPNINDIKLYDSWTSKGREEAWSENRIINNKGEFITNSNFEFKYNNLSDLMKKYILFIGTAVKQNFGEKYNLYITSGARKLKRNKNNEIISAKSDHIYNDDGRHFDLFNEKRRKIQIEAEKNNNPDITNENDYRLMVDGGTNTGNAIDINLVESGNERRKHNCLLFDLLLNILPIEDINQIIFETTSYGLSEHCIHLASLGKNSSFNSKSVIFGNQEIGGEYKTHTCVNNIKLWKVIKDRCIDKNITATPNSLDKGLLEEYKKNEFPLYKLPE